MQLVTPQGREDENAARRLWRALPGDLVLQLMAKVAEHKAQLATYKAYVPSLSLENLACYNCTGMDAHSGNSRWEPFWGPCCMRG